MMKFSDDNIASVEPSCCAVCKTRKREGRGCEWRVRTYNKQFRKQKESFGDEKGGLMALHEVSWSLSRIVGVRESGPWVYGAGIVGVEDGSC